MPIINGIEGIGKSTIFESILELTGKYGLITSKMNDVFG